MMLGHVRDSFARLTLPLPGREGLVNVEFIVDTGFEGELSLPQHLLNQLVVSDASRRPVLLADGTRRERPFHKIIVDWHDEPRLAEALALDGNPLLGAELLAESLLQAEMTDGGEVSVEPL